MSEVDEVDFKFEIGEKEENVPVLVMNQPTFVVKYKCNKCGYMWFPNSPNPEVCPHCRNNWREKPIYEKGDEKE